MKIPILYYEIAFVTSPFLYGAAVVIGIGTGHYGLPAEAYLTLFSFGYWLGLAAVELTQRQFGPLPIITFIDSTKVKTPIRAIGWCYRKAGFKPIGFTKRGLHVFEFQGVLV